MIKSHRRGLRTTTVRVPLHEDIGLQPERTSLAWGRTMLTMIVASTLFLRWVPHHGLFVGSLIAVSLLTALAIWITQRRRYLRGSRGISRERIRPDVGSVIWLSVAVITLAALGIYTVLFLSVPGGLR